MLDKSKDRKTLISQIGNSFSYQRVPAFTGKNMKSFNGIELLFTLTQTLWTAINILVSVSPKKSTRYDFSYLPSILSILISSHTSASFSSKSVVERGGGGEEPGSKGIQSFSKFSLLLYTEMITTVIPVPRVNYGHVKVK